MADSDEAKTPMIQLTKGVLSKKSRRKSKEEAKKEKEDDKPSKEKEKPNESAMKSKGSQEKGSMEDKDKKGNEKKSGSLEKGSMEDLKKKEEEKKSIKDKTDEEEKKKRDEEKEKRDKEAREWLQPTREVGVTNSVSDERGMPAINRLSAARDWTGFVTKEQQADFVLKDFIKKHFLAGSKRMEYELWELHLVLELAREEFAKCSTLLEVNAPVNICGDIHGQYGDLMRIFNSCGLPFKAKYLFLGDYVDRGRHSLEVIMMLLSCRISYANKVFLLRGNHELSNINKVYGFFAELRTRYRNPVEAKAVYDHFNEIFALMPLAALVSKRILCMHGGLSPELKSLDDIRKIERPLKVVKGLAQDLLWADPETGVTGFQPNKIRAVSHIFGEDAVHDKCSQLNIDMVIRAHQVVEFGYSFFAQRALVTVFSAARYHDELLNYAAVVKVDAGLEMSFLQLKPQEFDKVRKDMKRNPTGDAGGEEE